MSARICGYYDAMRRTKQRTFVGPVPILVVFLGMLLSARAQPLVDVLEWHNDHARTGQNLQESKLTFSSVSSNTFGKLFSYPVDGFVYAQPLCLSGVTIPGRGVRNLVFVATEHDSVYAFDADDGQKDGGSWVWHVSFIDPSAGVTSVPTSDLGITEPSELGITGTPVIDRDSGTLYLVVHTKEVSGGVGTYPQRLHALDVVTGQEKFGGPVVINVTAPGSGSNTDGNGQVVFDTLYEFQRPGLMLLNGYVYAAFASGGDVGPYHGWVLGFEAQTLKCSRIFNDTPNGYEGGIWMSGAAPAADDQGNLYCMTGNGDFDASVSDFGDSFIKLTPAGPNVLVADYFAPYNQALLNSEDGDLGSGGPMLLPDAVGSTNHPHLLVGCGKEGTIYLLDRDNMGHFHAGNDSQIVQSLPEVIAGTWSSPAYFNGWVYYQGVGDTLKAFAISNGALSTAPVSQNSNSQWTYPGGTPSISAQGTNNAIVWLLQTDTFYQDAPAILHAYNATNLEQELYSSAQAGPRDQPGLAQKFSVPVIANGKVYVPSGFLLAVYGTIEAPLITSQPLSQAALPGSTVTLRVEATGPGALSYQWQTGGVAISGATTATFSLNNATPDQSGSYAVTISNSFGVVTSAAASVLIVPAPSLAIDQDQQMLLTGTGGVTYEIEFMDQWGAPDWQPLLQVALAVDPVSPDESQASFDDPQPGDRQRFYRAHAVPEPPAGLK
jgi:Immunoglobulin domain